MNLVGPIIDAITVVMGIIGALIGVLAFGDAAVRRADAYPAADKQTKVTWLSITALSGVVLVLGVYPLLVFPPPNLLWLAASVGSLVYLLDVRPRLREVTDGHHSGW